MEKNFTEVLSKVMIAYEVAYTKQFGSNVDIAEFEKDLIAFSGALFQTALQNSVKGMAEEDKQAFAMWFLSDRLPLLLSAISGSDIEVEKYASHEDLIKAKKEDLVTQELKDKIRDLANNLKNEKMS